MTADLGVGVDCSTTAGRGLAWKAAHRPVAVAREAFQILPPRPGWGERDAQVW